MEPIKLFHHDSRKTHAAPPTRSIKGHHKTRQTLHDARLMDYTSAGSRSIGCIWCCPGRWTPNDIDGPLFGRSAQRKSHGVSSRWERPLKLLKPAAYERCFFSTNAQDKAVDKM